MGWASLGLSALGDGAQTLGGYANSWISGLMSNYWNKKSSRDNAAVATEYQKLLSDYNRQRDFEYAQKYNEVNLDLAQRYAENSASWTVHGLRRAGLNPILAASGSGVGSAQMGTPSPSVSGDGASITPHGSGYRADVSESLRDFATLGVQQSTAKQIQASTENIQAQTRTQELNTAKSAYDLLGNIMRGGSKGGVIPDIVGEVTRVFSKSSDKDKVEQELTNQVGRILENSLQRATGVQISSTPNDARSAGSPSRPATVSHDVAKPKSNPAPFGWSRRTRSKPRKSSRISSPFPGTIIYTP